MWQWAMQSNTNTIIYYSYEIVGVNKDRRCGRARVMAVCALWKSKNPHVIDLRFSLLEDSDTLYALSAHLVNPSV